ncbi:MAG: DsbA family protein [Alphaproteobacteria bacterium]
MSSRLRLLAVSTLCAVGLGAGIDRSAVAEDFSKEEIEQIVRDYLMEHPEVILDAVQAMQDRQAAEEAAMQAQNLARLREEVIGGSSTMIAGNPDGDVTLVEFFDYRCSYCRRVVPALTALIEADSGIRFAMKEFPILGEESVYAARAALAAANQDSYWEMHLALIDFRGTYDETSVRAIAADLGLDPDQLIADMTSPEVDAAINTNYELAQALGINGTPAFIIGDVIVPGAISLEAMQDLIDQARQG